MMIRYQTLAALLALTASAVAVTRSATADLLPLACGTGNQNQNYNPGIVAIPRRIHLTGSGQYSSCVSTDGRDISTASFTVNGEGTASCLLAAIPSQNTVLWRTVNGALAGASVIQFNSGVDIKPVGQSVVVITGTVISGLYAGHTVEKTIVLTNANLLTTLECLNLGGDGIVNSGGPVQIAIL
jgi:hypothetical protein